MQKSKLLHYSPTDGSLRIQQVGEDALSSPIPFTKGYNLITPFTRNSIAYFMCYASKTGQFEIFRLSKENAIESLGVWFWETGFTTLVPFRHLDQQYYLLYNTKKGTAVTSTYDFDTNRHVCLVKEDWGAGWSLYIPFVYDNYWAYLSYKSQGFCVSYHGSDGKYANITSLNAPDGITSGCAFYSANLDPLIAVYRGSTGSCWIYELQDDELSLKLGPVEIGAGWDVIAAEGNDAIVCSNSVTGNSAKFDVSTLNPLSVFDVEKGYSIIVPYVDQSYLTIMTFNIWMSAERVANGLNSVAEIIKEHNPDIVGVQECSADAFKKLRTLLGNDLYPHGTWDANAISKYPISKVYDKKGVHGYGVQVDVDGTPIRFFNSHLTAYPYGPYMLRDGQTVSSTLSQVNNLQGRDIGRILQTLLNNPKHDNHLPTIFVGDHNIPSHIDFTAASENNALLDSARNCKVQAIKWPVSHALQKSGYVDAYRQVYPDTLKNHGITWSPGYPKGRVEENEVHDRIDYIYLKSASDYTLDAIHSYTVDTAPRNLPYPSDHRAVVARVVLRRANALQKPFIY